jgi:hypothetical protein
VFAVLPITPQSNWPWLLLPILALVAWYGYRRTTPPLVARRRAVLIALRTVAYALLCIVLASPVWNRDRHTRERARIAILVDESASMSTVDVAGGGSRLERAQRAVAALGDALRDVPADLEVVPFSATAAAPEPLADYVQSERGAVGPGTDVVGALAAAADRARSGNLQAVVLVSDGRPTRGTLDPAQASTGVPVFTVGIGDTAGTRDLAIGRCEYSPVAYVDSEAEIDVRIEHAGFAGNATTLRLVQDGRDVHTTRVVFESERGRAATRIPLRFTRAGRQRYRLVLDALAGERTEINNTRELSIEVLPNRIRVLLVAARPDWDVGFWARALRDDPNVRVRVVTRDAGGGWIGDDGRAFAFPRGADWTRDWDLYVLAATGPLLQGDAGRDLVAAVQRGKGLLVLAGRDGVLGEPAARNRAAGDARSRARAAIRTRARAFVAARPPPCGDGAALAARRRRRRTAGTGAHPRPVDGRRGPRRRAGPARDRRRTTSAAPRRRTPRRRPDRGRERVPAVALGSRRERTGARGGTRDGGWTGARADAAARHRGGATDGVEAGVRERRGGGPARARSRRGARTAGGRPSAGRSPPPGGRHRRRHRRRRAACGRRVRDIVARVAAR